MCQSGGILSRAELHFHILPGVDDGPQDLAEAVTLGRMAVADGTGVVCATSHVRDLLARGALGEVPERVAEVRAALERADVPLELRTGGELAHDDLPLLGDRELEALAQGPPGRRWLLIEAPLFGGDVDGFLAGTAEVRARGFGTLVAHPERCLPLMEAEEALAGELAAGALLQMNGSSLTGRHGKTVRRVALGLVRSGRVHVIASDAHRPTRGPVLGAAVAALAAEGLAGAAVEALVVDNPRALLEHGMAAPRARPEAA